MRIIKTILLNGCSVYGADESGNPSVCHQDIDMDYRADEYPLKQNMDMMETLSEQYGLCHINRCIYGTSEQYDTLEKVRSELKKNMYVTPVIWSPCEIDGNEYTYGLWCFVNDRKNNHSVPDNWVPEINYGECTVDDLKMHIATIAEHHHLSYDGLNVQAPAGMLGELMSAAEEIKAVNPENEYFVYYRMDSSNNSIYTLCSKEHKQKTADADKTIDELCEKYGLIHIKKRHMVLLEDNGDLNRLRNYNAVLSIVSQRQDVIYTYCYPIDESVERYVYFSYDEDDTYTTKLYLF